MLILLSTGRYGDNYMKYDYSHSSIVAALNYNFRIALSTNVEIITWIMFLGVTGHAIFELEMHTDGNYGSLTNCTSLHAVMLLNLH